LNDSHEIELRRHALAIGIFENEDGVSMLDPLDCQYGRRIETDRSWTVYHVFTGMPAHVDGSNMIGLSRSEATDRMLSLNHSNAHRRKERLAQPSTCLRSVEAMD
jgi:hypothetical protein